MRDAREGSTEIPACAPEAPVKHAEQAQEHGQLFPYGRFLIVTGLQVAAFIVAYRWLFPDLFFAEIAQPWKIALWTFLFGLPISLFEYLYHRYMLHSAVFPFMAVMHHCHAEHHGLTNVKAPITQREPEKMVPVKNEYAIEQKHQEESMMFPLFAISVFIPLFLLFLGWLKFVFPGEPILISVMLCSTLAYSLYELWHAVLHLPFEKYWRPALTHPRWRRVTRHVYSFHLMHHWRPTANQAVIGFWGFAVWDYVFRTHRRPPRLPVPGAQVNYRDAQMKRPVWPISMLDKWQHKMVPWSRKFERWCTKIFLRRQNQP
jgi:hemolysin III